MARANEANYLRMQEALAHLEQNAPCEIVQKGSSEFYHGDRDRVSTHCDRFLLKVNRYMSQPVFCMWQCSSPFVYDSGFYTFSFPFVQVVLCLTRTTTACRRIF